MLHLVPEAAEMRPDEEIRVQRRELADLTALDQRLGPADAGQMSPVLDDGVNALLFGSEFQQGFCLGDRVRHRLFRENIAAV